MSIKTFIKGQPQVTEGTAYAILFTMGICHLLNDMIQSIIPAIYPLLKDKFGFTFAQIGIITLVFQLTSSVLQPFVGLYADRHPQPYSLATGMCFTLVGLIALAFAPNFMLLLLSVALIGCGSSVFHPEASRGCPDGVRREEEFGAIHLSSRGKRRERVRSFAGGIGGHTLRTTRRGVVCIGGVIGITPLVARRLLV